MTPIEIIALIVVLLTAIKIIVVLIKPKVWWINIVKPVYKNHILASIVSLILAGIVLYYLLEEITVVQIFAVMAFIALVACMTISSYSKEMLGLGEKLLKDKSILKKAWLPLVIWILLVLWALYELLIA